MVVRVKRMRLMATADKLTQLASDEDPFPVLAAVWAHGGNQIRVEAVAYVGHLRLRYFAARGMYSSS